MPLFVESVCWVEFENNVLYVNSLYYLLLDCAIEPKFIHFIKFLSVTSWIE